MNKYFFILILVSISLLAIVFLIPELLQRSHGCSPQTIKNECGYGGCFYYLDGYNTIALPWNVWWSSLFNRKIAEDWLVKKYDPCSILGKQIYVYQQEKNKCAGLCEPYMSSGCADMASAVSFCQEKVSIDINKDFIAGGSGDYGQIAGIPYCEDGLYCFHIYQCKCGGTELDAKNCLDIMKKYYSDKLGDESLANAAVCKAINPGTCEKDPRLWTKHILPYLEPVMIMSGKYAGQVLGADYWWKLAGYADVCESS